MELDLSCSPCCNQSRSVKLHSPLAVDMYMCGCLCGCVHLSVYVCLGFKCVGVLLCFSASTEAILHHEVSRMCCEEQQQLFHFVIELCQIGA